MIMIFLKNIHLTFTDIIYGDYPKETMFIDILCQMMVITPRKSYAVDLQGQMMVITPREQFVYT